MPGIKGFLETSFIDWPGRVCAVIFLGSCNLRCPFCHNHPLVLEPDRFPSHDLEEITSQLAGRRQWLGGVCVSGGEPTLDPQLPDLLTDLKQAGWPAKLDTNGTRPRVLARLFEAGLVDMVAMDVKAPLVAEKYQALAGTRVDLARINESIELIRQSGLEYQFRMTVVPGYHDEADVAAWARTLADPSGRGRLTLQNFNPRSTLVPELMELKSFDPARFDQLKGIAANPGKAAA